MANLDFHIHSDCDCIMGDEAEITKRAIQQFADAAEDYFHRVFSGEDILEAAGVNLLLAYTNLGKQVALVVEGILTQVSLD